MLSNKMQRLIRELIDATYDTGYYSGQKKDGSELHNNAIKLREKARTKLVEEIDFQIAIRDSELQRNL